MNPREKWRARAKTRADAAGLQKQFLTERVIRLPGDKFAESSQLYQRTCRFLLVLFDKPALNE
jgi:hypothetical protein